MASIRTKPYHLYRVSLKFPGSNVARASCTWGKPANVLGSLLTFGAAGSVGAASLAAGGVAVGGRVNGGGFDDSKGSACTWEAFQGSSLAWPGPFTSPREGNSCPNAGEPRAAASMIAMVVDQPLRVKTDMSRLPRISALSLAPNLSKYGPIRPESASDLRSCAESIGFAGCAGESG